MDGQHRRNGNGSGPTAHADAVRQDRAAPARVPRALAGLAFVEVETADDFVERVLAAVDEGATARRAAALAAVRGARTRAWTAGRRRAHDAADWARRSRTIRRGAVASSAIVVGALAVGLEARHRRRGREMRAA